MKILHMADCHLDTPFRSLPPKAAALRRQALRDGFRRALERGTREGVDAVLIAGDLFDNRYSAPSTVRKYIYSSAPATTTTCSAIRPMRDCRFSKT